MVTSERRREIEQAAFFWKRREGNVYRLYDASGQMVGRIEPALDHRGYLCTTMSGWYARVADLDLAIVDVETQRLRELVPQGR